LPNLTARPIAQIARVALGLALVCVLFLALAPAQDAPNLHLWDKAEHFLAFLLLAGIATIAFPQTKLIWIGLALSGLGGVIELIQGLPMVHRDAEFLDWVADTIAIACALISASAMPLRSWRAAYR
jgi:VanZ family protein